MTPPKVGDRHGKLVVLTVRPSGPGHRITVKCDCGTEFSISASKIFGSQCDYASCMQNGCRRTVHGHNKKGNMSLTYSSWSAMKHRTTNPKHMHYKTYVNRPVCERWMTFPPFLEDMGERPSKRHSIERIDNAKGYFKENCKWGTQKEQNNNKGNTVWVEFEGERLTISQWADKYGVPHRIMDKRIRRRGVEVALNEFKQKYEPTIN